MSGLVKKKKTRAGYRSYVTKINETHTILEKFEKLTVPEQDKQTLVSNVKVLIQTGGHKAI